MDVGHSTNLPAPNLVEALKTFRRVVRSGSYASAASEMNIASSSVSRQIEQLEYALDTRLLQRTTRRLTPTWAGQQLLERSKALLDDWVTLAAHWHCLCTDLSASTSAVASRLRVSCSSTFAEFFLLPLLPSFLEQYPRIALDLVLTEEHLDLIDNRLDVAIYLGHTTPSYHVLRLFGPEFILVATPAYLERYGCPQTPAEVGSHECILYLEGFRNFDVWRFRKGDETTLVPVHGRVHTNSGRGAVDMLCAGMGLLPLPPYVAALLLKNRQIVRLLPDYDIGIEGLLDTSVFAQYASHRHQPASVRTFLDFLMERMADLQESLQTEK